jgi:predicted NAD-dependent protein-ADP-ribosyltransferase YbiA (DUF1768 family)
MHDLVWAKFHQNKDLRLKLYSTGEAFLQEGTYWNDRIWGVDLKHKGPWNTRPGQNQLGIILMSIRSSFGTPPAGIEPVIL